MPHDLPRLDPHRVIVTLPPLAADDLVAAGEVLWQEELRVWSVARLADLEVLRPAFGRRATIGVHGLSTPAAVAEAVGAGAAFVASPWAAPGLVEAAGDVPAVLGGLTPAELASACALGPAAVQIFPVDAASDSYADALGDLIGPPPLDVPLIAAGRLTPAGAKAWLEAGAAAVWPTGLVTWELASGADLDALRARCQQWQLGY